MKVNRLKNKTKVLSVLSMTVIPIFACIYMVKLPELWCHSSTHTGFFFFFIQLARDLLHPSLDEEKKKT